jgi:hypothetical protein
MDSESGDVATKISEIPGKLWAIPYDGRIQLALTPESMEPRSGETQAALLQGLKGLQKFDLDFRSHQDCGFWVIDYDPWDDKDVVVYGDTNKPLVFTQELKTLTKPDISWHNQASKPGPSRYRIDTFK